MEKDQYDYLLKFIIIGNSNTGKSCLLHYFLENKCKPVSLEIKTTNEP
jgi:GTPase Era involved in 16S rRNA processing